MKNPFLKRFGILLVIVIWSFIAIAVIKIVFPAKHNSNPRNSPFEKLDAISYSKLDTYNLAANYSDPFLRGLILKDDVAIKNIPKASVKKTPPPAVINWPKVVYNGMVKNKQSNKQLALFIINDKETILNTGQEFEGIKLLKLFNDSAIVEFSREKRSFKK